MKTTVLKIYCKYNNYKCNNLRLCLNNRRYLTIIKGRTQLSSKKRLITHSALYPTQRAQILNTNYQQFTINFYNNL